MNRTQATSPKLGVLHATEPPTEQKKDAVREHAWWGRQWETNAEQSSLGAHATRSDQARVASSREDTGGLGGQNQRVRIASAPSSHPERPYASVSSSHQKRPTHRRRHHARSSPMLWRQLQTKSSSTLSALVSRSELLYALAPTPHQNFSDALAPAFHGKLNVCQPSGASHRGSTRAARRSV
jgi:hypothetical protein